MNKNTAKLMFILTGFCFISTAFGNSGSYTLDGRPVTEDEYNVAHAVSDACSKNIFSSECRSATEAMRKWKEQNKINDYQPSEVEQQRLDRASAEAGKEFVDHSNNFLQSMLGNDKGFFNTGDHDKFMRPAESRKGLFDTEDHDKFMQSMPGFSNTHEQNMHKIREKMVELDKAFEREKEAFKKEHEAFEEKHEIEWREIRKRMRA